MCSTLTCRPAVYVTARSTCIVMAGHCSVDYRWRISLGTFILLALVTHWRCLSLRNSGLSLQFRQCHEVALAALNDTTVLQQLLATNLALMASVASLTTTNKTLAEALAKKGVAMPAKATSTEMRIQQTRLSWVIIAGPTVIRLASTTQV